MSAECSVENIPPGYKKTEVGVIPEDWDCIESTALVTYFGGNAFKSQDATTSGVRWLKIANVGRRQIEWAETSFLPQSYVNEFKSYLLQAGDVVMALTRPILDGELKIARLTSQDVPCLLNQRVAKVIPKSKSDLGFIYCVVQTAHFVEAMNEAMAGTDPPNIGSKALGKILVPVPPTIFEQKAIAEALSDADAFIKSLEQLIVKKRQIKQGAMQELLTGKRRLPGFSGEWETKLLGNTAILKARIGWQGLTTNEYLDSGDYYLVTGTEFKDGYIDWSNCHYVTESRYKQDRNIQLKEHDVLVTKDGTIGKVALINHLHKPATLNSGVFVIRPIEDAFYPDFFYYLLCSNIFTEFLVQLSAGSTINHLYQKDFINFIYKTPATIEEQTAIAAILSDMDSEITALEEKLAKALQVKQGMMQELLTGRIRLL